MSAAIGLMFLVLLRCSTTVDLVVPKILIGEMIHSTTRISTFHRKVEVGPTRFFEQLLIDKKAGDTHKVGGQFFIATFHSDTAGPKW